jgi:spore germination protein KC
MKKLAVMLVLSSLILTGCWSKKEMTERAFVIAIAADRGEKGKLELTFQIYKPTSQFGAPSVQDEKSAFINLTVEGSSIFNIVRNNATITGRRSQFSHIQIILFSEEAAQEVLEGLLDFFYREPEMRLSAPVMITKGKARDYLYGDPMIENTIGSQIQKQLNVSAELAGNTVRTTLLELAFQLKNESGSAMMPYLMTEPTFGQRIVQGIALIKKDKMVHWVDSEQAQYLLMLADKYKYGVIEIPCSPHAPESLKETFEVLKVITKMKPAIRDGDEVSVSFDVRIEGSIGELVCTSIRDLEDEQRFVEKLELYVEEQLKSVMNMLQQKGVDGIGIGHRLYQRHPSRWKSIRQEWDDIFPQVPVDIQVTVINESSKMMNPGPFAKTGEEK